MSSVRGVCLTLTPVSYVCFVSLGCLQGIVEYVNKYAFTQVAIYGKAFIPAAKDTWTILKDRGIVQLINDNLIGNVWAMGAIMAGVGVVVLFVLHSCALQLAAY